MSLIGRLGAGLRQPRRATPHPARVLLLLLGLLLVAAGLALPVAAPDGPERATALGHRTLLLRRSLPIGPGELRGIAVAPDGGLLVSDLGGYLLRLGADGSYRGALGPGPGPGAGRDAGPSWRGVAFDAAGFAYAVDARNARVARFAPDGSPAGLIELAPFGPYGPSGVAVDAAGQLYVANTGRDQVLVLSPTGALLRTLGSSGTGPSQLRQPTGLKLGPGADLYVADMANRRVQVFTSREEPVASIDLAIEPLGVAVDAQGRVFVLGQPPGSLPVFSRQGQPLGFAGRAPDGGDLVGEVRDAALARDGSLLVVSPREVVAIELGSAGPASDETPLAPRLGLALLGLLVALAPRWLGPAHGWLQRAAGPTWRAARRTGAVTAAVRLIRADAGGVTAAAAEAPPAASPRPARASHWPPVAVPPREAHASLASIALARLAAPLRWVALGLGLGFAAVALWVFYLGPRFGWESFLDPWEARYRCAVAAWCSPDFNLPSQPGMLAALLAVAGLAVGLGRARGVWSEPDELGGPARPAAGGWSPRLVGSLLLAGAGLVVVGLEAVGVLRGQPPAPPLWLAGILALAVAAAFWDLRRPAELALTLADLAVAVGVGLVLLGAGALLGGRSPALLLAGAATFVLGLRLARRLGSAVHPLEHVAVLALSLAALALAMSRAWSWQFAFIGDEWVFYNGALNYLHDFGGPSLLRDPSPTVRLLAAVNPRDYHTVLSTALQAWTMQLAGENVFGWRLSAVLPFALAVAPAYAWLRRLAGREAALLGAGLLASSHVLQTFPMVAYNNTQALLPLTLGLGFLGFALSRPSLLRYLLVGASLGLALLVFGLARLALPVVGLLLLALVWPGRASARLAWGATLAGGLAVAAPTLFSLSNWSAMLKATPVQSEVAARGVGLLAQMTSNGVQGLFAFLDGPRGHYIGASHADPLTALLVLAGVGFALGSLRRRAAWAWLLAGGLFVLLVGAVQQYGHISNTRMYVLPPVYAIFAGLGGAALLRVVLPVQARARGVLVGALVLAGAGLNYNHVERVSLPTINWTPPETLIVQQLQLSAAADRGGMPVLLVDTPPDLPTFARAYDVPPERLVALTGAEALARPDLCADADRPALWLVGARSPQLAALRARLAGCWPGLTEAGLANQHGEVVLHRFATAAGEAEVARPPSQRITERQHPDRLQLPDPGDLAVGPDGTLFGLSTSEARVYRYSPEGRPLGSFGLAQTEPSALAVTDDGLVVVAATGAGGRVVWYDSTGQEVRRAADALGLQVPRGLLALADGALLVADQGTSRIVRLSPAGQPAGEIAAGQLRAPSALARDPAGGVWVLNGGAELLLVSPADRVTRRLRLTPQAPEQVRRVVATADGDLLLADPPSRRVLRLDGEGRLRWAWAGFRRPAGLALDRTGRLLVADAGLDEVTLLPPVSVRTAP